MTALRTTIVSLSFTLLTAASALAGAPLETDDAGTVDVGAFEIGISGSYMSDKEDTTKTASRDAELSLGTGIYKNLGISVALPYNMSTREKDSGVLVGKDDGFGDMSVDIKYVFAEVSGVNLAIRPGVVLPTGKSSMTEDHVQFTTALIATKEFSDGAYAMHANLGYEFHTYKDSNEGMRRNLWSASLAGEAELAKGFIAVADFGLATNPEEGVDDLPAYALAGARYEINDNFEVNAGVKLGLTKSEDDISVLYGLLLKF
ncbi:MAG: transporter [Geobacteraceae bacterium]|nr:transporter [Geobacteraceae bacterium]NTW80018.1 transporter [Geobacteraceae bacterium]